MTGPEHYREAECLLSLADEIVANHDDTNPAAALLVARAQVHATLAQAWMMQDLIAGVDHIAVGDPK